MEEVEKPEEDKVEVTPKLDMFSNAKPARHGLAGFLIKVISLFRHCFLLFYNPWYSFIHSARTKTKLLK
jgi:hypothetical protein